MKATKAGIIIGQAITGYTDPSQPAYVVAFVKNGDSNGASISSLLPGLVATEALPVVGPDGEPIETAPTVLSQFEVGKQALSYFASNKAALGGVPAALAAFACAPSMAK